MTSFCFLLLVVTENMTIELHPLGFSYLAHAHVHARSIVCFICLSFIHKDAEVYCETQTVNVSTSQVVTLPRMRAPSFVELPCVSTGKSLLVARCERLGHNSSLAEFNVTLSKDSCFDNMSLPGLVDLYLVRIFVTPLYSKCQLLKLEETFRPCVVFKTATLGHYDHA